MASDTIEPAATVTEIYRYLAGGSLDTVPAKLTDDQKAAYPLARFQREWKDLPEVDRAHLRIGIGTRSFSY